MELIGVLHLPRTPSISSPGEMAPEDLIDRALEEAVILGKHGFNKVIIENYGDRPYLKRVTDPLRLSLVAIIAREVARSTSLITDINILRNSGREAYSIAVSSRAGFIRVNSLVETLNN